MLSVYHGIHGIELEHTPRETFPLSTAISVTHASGETFNPRIEYVDFVQVIPDSEATDVPWTKRPTFLIETIPPITGQPKPTVYRLSEGCTINSTSEHKRDVMQYEPIV